MEINEDEEKHKMMMQAIKEKTKVADAKDKEKKTLTTEDK
jgi:hypothetical protein